MSYSDRKSNKDKKNKTKNNSKPMALSTNKCEVHHFDISIPNMHSALLKENCGIIALYFLFELK